MGRGDNRPNSQTPQAVIRYSLRAIENARRAVIQNAQRIAQLGEWPEYIDPVASLAGRVPAEDVRATGFDAGIASALDMIPRDRQRLSAGLHAAYTPELVEQVIRESVTMDPDSETTWWLAACSVCKEGTLSERDFANQLNSFSDLVGNPNARRAAAVSELRQMRQSFEAGYRGIPFAVTDGGMQGAYICGHKVSAMYAAEHGLYFIGTYNKSLGLDDFEFADNPELSGPVHGSKQFVKCANCSEFERAVDYIKSNSDLL